jgi:NAD(P)H-hydrate epimerase
VDLIVDALLGTGLERDVAGEWAEALAAAHAYPAPILAIDIPSGLHADSGELLGVAAEAAATITFIGLKQGLFTGNGPALTGRVYFDDLDVPAEVYAKQQPASHRIDWRQQSALLKPRRRITHKGKYGHLLVVGGDYGYSGAVRMAAEAAARSGAGLVSVATRRGHVAQINIGRPELMCHAIEEPAELRHLLAKVDAVAVGPGLGQSAWGVALFGTVLESNLPLVVDADALNLLAVEPTSRDGWVLTPHPGEAARMLGCKSSEIQADRLGSAAKLQQKYGGVVVLKGAGSVIRSGSTLPPSIATEGNPGMASGGMGDLLTGIIGGLWVQGFSAGEAARMGVCLHAAAGDRAAADGGERGLLASDLLPWIRPLLNPMQVVR